MDLSTIIGFALAFGAVIAALYMDGGNIQELFAHMSASSSPWVVRLALALSHSRCPLFLISPNC